MANNPQITQAAGKAALDAITALFGAAATLKIYDGTPAATANTALGAQVLLANLAFGNPAFGAATTADPSVATANAITQDSAADATGTATWARLASSTPTTVVDMTVGAASADIILNTASIVTGAVVSVTALTLTQPLT